MKLLWIGDALIENSISRVAHAILDNFPAGWDVTLFAYTHGKRYDRMRRHNYNVVVEDGTRGQGPVLVRKFAPDVACFFSGAGGAFAACPILAGMRAAAASIRHPVAALCYQPMEMENLCRDLVRPLNGYDRVIVPAAFCAEQLMAAGIDRRPEVIPHGVDRSLFFPMEPGEARRTLGLPAECFIVGCVNGNFRRKRLDLSVRYVASWIRDKPPGVKFYYHGFPNSPIGWNIPQLCEYYGISDRLVLNPALEVGCFVDSTRLRAAYSAMDVHISTSWGEGFGLTVAESMACGVAQIVPENSALAEWPRGAVHYVPCTSVYTAAYGEQDGQNCIGRIPDESLFVQGMELLYRDECYRRELGRRALERISEPQFRWPDIATRFAESFHDAVTRRAQEPKTDDATKTPITAAR